MTNLKQPAQGYPSVHVMTGLRNGILCAFFSAKQTHNSADWLRTKARFCRGVASLITDARHAFDARNRQAQDMDMGELTREELTARLEAVEARIDARAQATDSKIEALEYRIDAKVQQRISDLIKWIVATAIAMTAIGSTIIALLLNNIATRQFPAGVPAPAVSAPAPVR